jgi:hypothetical protein
MSRVIAGMIGVVAVLILACGTETSTVPSSSLQACDFDIACPTGEVCNVSQECGFLPDGGGSCGDVTGDKRCHRDCGQSQTCASDEACTKVYLADRSDFSEGGAICE